MNGGFDEGEAIERWNKGYGAIETKWADSYKLEEE